MGGSRQAGWQQPAFQGLCRSLLASVHCCSSSLFVRYPQNASAATRYLCCIPVRLFARASLRGGGGGVLKARISCPSPVNWKRRWGSSERTFCSLVVEPWGRGTSPPSWIKVNAPLPLRSSGGPPRHCSSRSLSASSTRISGPSPVSWKRRWGSLERTLCSFLVQPWGRGTSPPRRIKDTGPLGCCLRCWTRSKRHCSLRSSPVDDIASLRGLGQTAEPCRVDADGQLVLTF
mmetsp:Transcript_8195/g.19995  ORF Transcript_8195/g.19995 Transcript_8195/m.19995 type:complete len:232 (+) Transcript_8195:1486-2181(+)